jgi:hypothetical protein
MYWTQHGVVRLEPMDRSPLSSTFMLVFDCSIINYTSESFKQLVSQC